MKDSKFIPPKYYNGRLLNQERSDFLKDRLLSYIEKLKSINEFLVPAILYIAAWSNKEDNDIWYEYVGDNFQEIFGSDMENLPKIFRESVIDRKIYIQNEDRIRIQTQNKDFFLNQKTDIRSELEYSGFNEAVYKIKIKNDILWLKDQAVVIPFERDKITISIGNLTNVTKEMEAEEARKNAELALLKNEKLLRTLFNQAYDPIIIADLKGTILDCNEVSQEIFGHLREDILGNKYYDFISNEERERVKGSIEGLCNKKSIRFETSINTPTGEKIPTEISAVRIENDPPVVQAFIRDISEKNKIENERIKLSKFELVSTMASGIAHDINNILSIILGNLSLAAMESSKTENDNISNILKRIEKASLHLETLTKKFFKFSDASVVIKQKTDIFAYLSFFKEKYLNKADIKIEIEDGMDSININKSMMEPALDAVFSNALEAMEGDCHKQIIIKTSREVISDRDQTIGTILKKGDYTRIEIRDSGKGIPEKYLDRVLDPYFSTKPFTSKKGTGLGLTNAYSIIKQHNGHIHINSSPVYGTAVNIYLPE